MIDFLKDRRRPNYEALNTIEISKQSLLANFSLLQGAQPEALIIPVLKSNAYGHGLKEVCQVLNSSPATIVAVDSFPEAQIAYRYFKGRVLIIGEMPEGAYRYCNLKRTSFIVYNLETLKRLSRFGKQAKVHLFVNSGMNREGISDIKQFLEAGKVDLDKVQVEGFCSHLASAETSSDLNQRQITRFFMMLDELKVAGFDPKLVHLGNSAGVFTLQDQRLTAFRAGLSFYGYNPFAPEAKAYQKATGLRPALSIRSKIVSVQNLSTGETVSYNESYQAKKPVKIAVIPFGYYEGLDRRLSNNFEFRYQGPDGLKAAKVAGKVCMNLSCLEIDGNPQVGEEIILMDREAGISADDWASAINTINYEVLVKIQANIRRKIA